MVVGKRIILAINMKDGQKLWTKDELMLAINLYCKLPFGKMHKGNPAIIGLAKMIARTPSSVAYKLVNFASLDPSLQARGIKGASNTSKLDKQIWDEFYHNWDAALIESEQLLANANHVTVEALNQIDVNEILQQGLDKERLVKTRVNQSIFRKMVLAAYNNTCCITGIDNPELLNASHIVPWSKDEKNRLNPMNGLCLNALHDRAFDKYLLTINAEDYTIQVSSKLRAKETLAMMDLNFFALVGKEIRLPDKFLPDRELLKRHNEGFVV
ncbi:HNH endonuclease [Parasediminibacterium sp. JCM 36343]|uniref:HNH endonuclease n=1 Tax=Parasediminibacterium sp. JCM 36343 TaxID=3374279 RepID=UPI00397BEBB6